MNEGWARILNDCDKRLPKGRSRCFDIGSWGGCGVSCGAFIDGECDEPQEIPKEDIIKEYGKKEAIEIMERYGEEIFK